MKGEIEGKWRTPGKGVAPPLPYLRVVAIERGALRSPPTAADKLTYVFMFYRKTFRPICKFRNFAFF